MKIAHVMTRFSPEENPGGVERVVEELAVRQNKEHEVEIICRNQFDDPEEEECRGVKVKRASTVDVSGLKTFSSLFSMRKLIKDSEADVFHIHDWSPYLNYIAAGEPDNSVLTLHNRAFSLLGRSLQDLSIQRANTTTVVSKSIQERLKSEVQVIPNGTDLDEFKPQDSEGYYAFAGNLVEAKGVKEMTKVWRGEWPKLKIAGSGPLENRLPDKGNIKYLGELPHSEIQELIAKSEALILPSRSEGFGLVWSEALSCGKPVLATYTGIGSYLPDKCGVIIDSDFDQELLSEGIEKLLQNDYDSKEIRDFAEDRFSWDKISESYINLYEDLI